MHRSRPAVSLLVPLAALTLACGGKQKAPPQMPPPQVTVVTLHAEPLTLTRELPGRTSAFLVAEVRPQVSGIVKRRLFTEGGLVRAGEPLYELDDAVYRADYENARAALAKSESSLTAARLAAKRATELRKVDAVSAQEEENAVAAMRAAEADVAAQKAAVARQAVNLRYAKIAAPISGRVGKSSVTPGALVTENQQEPLVTVQQLDPIYVDVAQSSLEWLKLRKEIDAGQVMLGGKQGTPVKIVLEDGSTYPHEGKLQFADVTVDTGTGSFGVRAIVPNPDLTLRPGMYVRAVLPEAHTSSAVLAPQQAITRDPKGNATAMVVGGDGKVELRPVKVSRTIGDRWLVDEGLAAGDRVIVEGLQKVQPGMPVQAVEATASASTAAPAPSPAQAGG